MLQQQDPDDYVIATGETHSVSEFLDESFNQLDLDWHDHVEIDARYLRPTDVGLLQGDPTKSRNLLGWNPKVNFKQLVKMMIDSDMELAHRDRALVDAGFAP